MDERYGEQFWWRTYRDLPFATLVRIVDTYCNPELDEDAYPTLVRRAGTRYEEMRVFRDELRRALQGEWYPRDTLFDVGQYDDASDEEFLVRLWRDLYPGESVPRPGRS